MKRLLYHLGLIDLVWTVDKHGPDKVRLRVVRHKDGKRYVAGLLSYEMNQLGPKGTFIDKKTGYLLRWEPYEKRPKKDKFRLISRKQSRILEVQERLE